MSPWNRGIAVAQSSQWSARNSVFAPLGAGGRADAVVQRLTEAINLGLISRGERLPVETELADQFGVSSATLREALAILREQGLVETRRGRKGGTFALGASRPPGERLRKRLAALTMTELRDLGDELFAVSGAAAKLAAARAGEGDIERLENVANQLAKANSFVDKSRADSRFHIEIAVVSQSERLTRAEVRLQGEVAELLWGALTLPLDRDNVHSEHTAIADAIAAEDDDRAEHLARQHARDNVRRLIEAHMTLAGPS